MPNSLEKTPVKIRLNARLRNRDEALRTAGAMLIDAGFAQAPFTESLLRREQIGTTFLGHGIAIPHGMIEDKHLIRRTGLAVLQVPDGVAWGNDPDGNEQRVKLVVAIAAASDEHIRILRRLTRLMQDDAGLRRLQNTRDAEEIITALTGSSHTGNEPVLEDFPTGQGITLNYPNGLHARPAGRWVETVRRFKSQVHVRHADRVADARSVASLLSLGAGHNARLRISAQGDDAQSAISALIGVIRMLDDEELRQASLAEHRQSHAQSLGHNNLGDWHPGSEQQFCGIAAAPGLVTGTLVMAQSQELQAEDRFSSISEEASLLDQALSNAEKQLGLLISGAERQGRIEQAAIFKTHLELLRDAGWIQAVSRSIIAGHGAAWSWQQALNERISRQQALKDATLAARSTDLQDVGERVLRNLLGQHDACPAGDWPDDAILLADDLAPSFTAQLDTSRIRGFCTARGGPTAHTAILARALGLPAVVAAGPEILAPALTAGNRTRAILDGYRGCLYVAPDESGLQEARQHIASIARLQADEAENSMKPAITRDGHRISIGVNVNRAEQARQALAAGAEGVGLMRTEFLFLERDHIPDEQEQYQVYRAMVDVLAGKPLIVRTLDIGGDKQIPHMPLPHEENPFLGVRGARLLLRRDDLLVPQLRALYRAARHGPLSIMFPMISTVEEVKALRTRAQAIRQDVDGPEVPLGIMIEVPSAAQLADQLARHVDFFSIGTNDLTQYTLAIDRQHPELAAMADSLHPAVLRLIAETVAGARPFKRHVGVCGALAADPLGAAILAGLGVDELSMSTSDLGTIKALLRRHTLHELQALAQKALNAETIADVRALGAALQPASGITAGDPA